MSLLGQETQEGIYSLVYSWLKKAKHLINACLKFGVTLQKKREFNCIPKSQWQIWYQGSQGCNSKVLLTKHSPHLQPSAWVNRSQTSAWIAAQYRDDKNVSLKMYLPADEVPEASVELKQHLSEEESKSTDWLQSNYMHSRMRRYLHRVLSSNHQHCFCKICGLYMSACRMNSHVPKITSEHSTDYGDV